MCSHAALRALTHEPTMFSLRRQVNFKDFKRDARNLKAQWMGESMYNQSRADRRESAQTSLQWENFGQIVFTPWANAFKRTNNQLAWAQIGINPFTRLPAMDLFEAEYNRGEMAKLLQNRKTPEYRAKAAVWAKRGLEHTFPQPVKRAWKDPADACSRFTTGDCALAGPLDDAGMLDILEARQKKKDDASTEKLERAAQKLVKRNKAIADGEIVWGKVLRKEISFEGLRHADADPLAACKGLSWPKGKALAIKDKQAAIREKLAADVDTFQAALAATAAASAETDGSAATAAP